MSKCSHREAQYRCQGCRERVRAEFKEFPLQADRGPQAKPGPLSVPWAIADLAWAGYFAKWGCDQSVERLAERGGFSWGEMDMFYPQWRTEVDLIRSLQAEAAGLRAALVCPCSEYGTHRCIRCDSEVES